MIHSDQILERPLTLRIRPDLTFQAQVRRGNRYWVVKDPTTLRYHQLREEEYSVLRQLDGTATLGSIKQRFEQSFAPRKVRAVQLQSLLGILHRQGLVISDAQGQGEQLLLRHRRNKVQQRLTTVGGVLAIKLPGIDPEPLLDWIYPRVRWLFSPWCVSICVALFLAALTLVTVQFDEVRARLPDIPTFFTMRNAVVLGVALAATKVLHELGHALTCRHFGGECHEMGIMLLVFTPCLYCNVTDSWMIPNKWCRMSVTAAGIYVEVVLASLCTFLWWFSEPGLLNSLCLSVMFICSIGTVIFNGNPLLRYDGYFILSDLIDVPNLWQQSRALLQSWLRRVCLGVQLPFDHAWADTRRGLLLTYAIASTLYRWSVLIAILMFLFEILRPMRLQFLAQAITGLVLGGILMLPAVNAWQFFDDPGMRRLARPKRVTACGVLLVTLLLLSLVLPLPYRIQTPVVVKPRAAHRVFVTVPGNLAQKIQPGVEIMKGDKLATLDNQEMEYEVAQLEADYRRKELQLQNLERLRSIDRAFGAQIPTVRASLSDVQERLAQRRRDVQRLVIMSPIAGTILPPAERSAQLTSDLELSTWSGSPLDDRNLDCHLETGTLLCWVAPSDKFEAMLYVDQSDVAQLRPGQHVRVRLEQLGATILHGRLEEISKIDATDVPAQLASELHLQTDETGVARPAQTVYEARVLLNEHDQHLLMGAMGRAKVLVDAKPLGWRLLRYLRQTFAPL